MAPRVIFDAAKQGRGAKWLMIGMFAVLLGLMGVVRWCGD